MALGDGLLDSAVAKVEAYVGQFLQTRQQLLDAQSTINAALRNAAGSGSAAIGANTFTTAQLQALSTENANLLAQNADLTNRIASFRESVAAVEAGATTVMDTLVTDSPDWMDTGIVAGDPSMSYGMGNGLGLLPVAIPAAVLIGTGAVLATAIYLFLGNVKDHVASVAGGVSANLLIYGGIALVGVWYLKKKGIL